MAVTRTTAEGSAIIQEDPNITAEIRAEQAINNSLDAKKERLKDLVCSVSMSRINKANQHVARKPIAAMRAMNATTAPTINSNTLQAEIAAYLRDCAANEANHIISINALTEANIDGYDVNTGWPE